jgi:mono/diheme cytochrome c family protein
MFTPETAQFCIPALAFDLTYLSSRKRATEGSIGILSRITKGNARHLSHIDRSRPDAAQETILTTIIRGRWIPLWTICFILLLGVLFKCLPAQQLLHYTHAPDPVAGRVIYNNGCIACHGANGKGAPQASTRFVRPDTWPDFTRCDQTTPEPDSSYKAVIVHGGRGLGFSQIMPAFGDLLTDDQINDVISYLRTFCHNVHHYPRGELNVPRALVTEKAFPEDELVLSTAAAATGAPSWTTDVVHEQTFAGRNQIEIDVPINYADQNHQWTSGPGDITLGLKREFLASLRTGAILSLQGGVLLPTGDSHRGFGAGTTTFEPFAAYDQLIHNTTSLQFQLGADITADPGKSPRSLFFRTAIGQSIARDHGLGRLFTPMVEILGTRDYAPGASTDMDILPQMQVTVNRRQQIRADVGVRQPFTDTAGRHPQIVFYVLWDWAEGKFWEGWK